MTGGEMERGIDFLLRSQATLVARIGQVNDNLSKQIGELKNRRDELARTQSHFVRVVTRTFEEQAEIKRRHDEADRRLAKAVETMAGTQRGLAETHRGMAETQRSSAEDQSHTVERYIKRAARRRALRRAAAPGGA